MFPPPRSPTGAGGDGRVDCLELKAHGGVRLGHPRQPAGLPQLDEHEVCLVERRDESARRVGIRQGGKLGQLDCPVEGLDPCERLIVAKTAEGLWRALWGGEILINSL
jgi:hypothetical protein